jgi:response regulator RpfG family c-di-GMP phosphodiesterase
MKTDGKELFKVLFVDDEENVLRSLRRLFMDEDAIEVFTAQSGKEGIEILKKNDISVIVSDQRMPEMSGVEFLENAKKISPYAVRIVLTGYADVNAAVDAINKGGVHRYLSKPWNDSDMVLAVWDAVERCRLVKENKRLTELTRKQNEELKKWSDELQFLVQQQTIDITKQNKELNDLNLRLRRNFSDFIKAFCSLLELRDRTALNHSNNVASLSEETARLMKLDAAEIEKIKTAAQLHDIGNIGMSDIAMSKRPSEMSEDELLEYKKHPVRGQSTVDVIADMRDIGVIIRHHHEWHDGKGFPDGIKGREIPLGSRIIAMADQFDRLMHGFKAHAAKNVLEKMRTQLGVQFDPELFGYFSSAALKLFSAIAEVEIQMTSKIELELLPASLKPGMALSRDIRSGTGILLLGRGVVLNDKNIETLKRSYYIDPSSTGVFVLVEKK